MGVMISSAPFLVPALRGLAKRFQPLGIFTVAYPTCPNDCPNEVALHARGALNRGAKREEIIETILQCAPYVGFPKTNHALKAAKDVLERWEAKKEDWKAL